MERIRPLLAVALGCIANSCVGQREPANVPGAQRCQKSTAKLAVRVDQKSVNLDEGRLLVRTVGPVCSILLKVRRNGGLPPVERRFAYTGAEQELRWDPVPRDQVAKVEVWVASSDDDYQGVALEPWATTIERIELEFAADDASIPASAAGALEDTIVKLKEAQARLINSGVTMKVFLVAHSAPVNGPESDMGLLQERAQAVADWLKRGGVCIPIAYAGLDEAVAEQIDTGLVERSNRRVDFLVGVKPPVLVGGIGMDWTWLPVGC